MTSSESQTIQLRVLSGGPAGSTFAFEPGLVSIGRGAEAGIRFDAERDLSVSGRHAALYFESDRWWIRDLDSRNGTYVNGRRLTGPRALGDGDRVALGAGGPELQVRVAATAAAEPSRPDLARPLWIATSVVAVLLGVIAMLLVANARQRRAFEDERAALIARADSLLAAGEQSVLALRGQREELADALDSAQRELRTARTNLDRAVRAGDDSLVDVLRRDLQARTVALERQQLAASLDFDAIERGNRSAVALVYVEDQAGTVSTGTAFAVRPDAVLVTARHVIAGQDGTRRPVRIGVQFSDSDQVFPARVEAIAPNADVAVIRAQNIIGAVPVIRGFNARLDTLGAGTPVAFIGFPLGGTADVADGTSTVVARPLVSAGIITRKSSDRIEIQGPGAAGASGSPIFDATGQILGLLFGGVRDDNGQVVYGVPTPRILATLQAVR